MFFPIILKGIFSNHFILGWEVKGGVVLPHKLTYITSVLADSYFRPGFPLVRHWLEEHISLLSSENTVQYLLYLH